MGWPVAVELPQECGEPASVSDVSLLVPPDLSTAEAARRAMSRPAQRRFDPLVCIDRTGSVLGVIAVSDLVVTLAG
jgi:hypothetical protein